MTRKKRADLKGQETFMSHPRRVEFTWIDDLMAHEHRLGLDYGGFRTGRWRIFEEECSADLMVVVGSDKDVFKVHHEPGSGDGTGGDDTYYAARDIAAGIERWSSACLGVDAPLGFFQALKRDVAIAARRAEEARVEAIRCRNLYVMMSARAKVAQAEAVQRGWSTPHSPSPRAGEDDCGS